MKTKTSQAQKIRNTIAYLKHCQAMRTAGRLVSYITDPAWLLDQAINRRAGWPEDPSHSRGSCRIKGHNPKMQGYPWKAQGWALDHLRILADNINHNVIVRRQELGEWGKFLMSHIPYRITQAWEE